MDPSRYRFRQVVRLAALLVLLLALVAPVSGQGADPSRIVLRAKELLSQGVSDGDPAPIHRARSLLEGLTGEEAWQPLAHYYLGYAGYRLAEIAETGEKKEVVPRLNEAIKHLKKAIKKDDAFAEAYALLASSYGQKIPHRPLLAPFLGPKSGSRMKKARELEPRNPRIEFLEAIGLYFTPSMFGGDPEKALEGFLRAARLFREWNPPAPVAPAWGEPEAWAWAGKIDTERGELDQAESCLKRSLELDPGYRWVRQVLLPGLEEQREQPAD